MKARSARYLIVASFSLVALTGCTNKKDQARIKELEQEVETLNDEHSTAMNNQTRGFQERETTLRGAESKASEQVRQLTTERDQVRAELANLKRQVEQAEAARLAAMPKNASTPGHPDFNPAKESKITDALASVTGDKVSGTGFVVAADGKRYLYTAANVLTGNSRVTIANTVGRKFAKFGNLEIAEGTGIVRLELVEAADAPALELSEENAKPGSGTAVTSLANKSGSVSSGSGNSFGQSAETIETDPAMMQGMGGGALVETANGKVLAVILNLAAEQKELWVEPGVAGEEPYRAFRINRSLSWKPVPVATFLAEARRLNDYNRLTRVAQALASLTPSSTGLGLGAGVSGSFTVVSVLNEAKSLPFVAEILSFNEQLASKKTRSGGAELKKRYMNMIDSATSQINRSGEGFDPVKFTPYYRALAEKSVKWRKEAMERLLAASQNVEFTTVREEPRSKGMNGNPNK